MAMICMAAYAGSACGDDDCQLKPFAQVKVAAGDVVQASFDKKKYWVFGVLMVALSFVVILVTNRIFNPFMPYFEVLPLFFNWWVIFMYLGFMGLLACCCAFLAVFYCAG